MFTKKLLPQANTERTIGESTIAKYHKFLFIFPIQLSDARPHIKLLTRPLSLPYKISWKFGWGKFCVKSVVPHSTQTRRLYILWHRVSHFYFRDWRISTGWFLAQQNGNSLIFTYPYINHLYITTHLYKIFEANKCYMYIYHHPHLWYRRSFIYHTAWLIEWFAFRNFNIT